MSNSPRPPRVLLALAGGIVALLLLPAAYLLLRAAGAGPEGWAELARPNLWRVLGKSLLLAGVVTAASILVGVPLAWLTTRTDLPARRFWSVAVVLPLAMPSYISAYAFIGLLGPRGLAARALGIDRLPDIYGLPGAALVIASITYPFVVLGVRSALKRMDPALEESARGLGCSRPAAFFRVIFPQLRPAVAASGLLVALYALSDFGSPALMQYDSFTRVIYTQYRSSFDRDAAALTSLLLIVLTLVLLAGAAFWRGHERWARVGPAAERRARVVRLGLWKAPALAFCALVLAGSLGLPVAAMIYWLAEGLRNGQPFALSAEPIFNSLLAGALAALAASAAALPIALLAVRFRGGAGEAFSRAAYIGNALPGIVVALALVFFGARHAPWLYQTLPMLVFALVVRFLPESLGCVRASLNQINPRLEDAARGLGRGPLRSFVSVTLPLLLPGLLAGAALVFLTAVKELPVTLLLAPTGFDTLVGEVWSAAGEGLFSQASPSALLLVLISGFSVTVILAQERRGWNG